MSGFTAKEKKKFRLRKYMQTHFFEFLVDMVVNVAFALLLLWLCHGTAYVRGVVLAIGYSLGKAAYNIHAYQKNDVDVDSH